MTAVATATPSRLPPHHVPRPRLVARLRAATLGIVEAAGGYGKSVLAAELADALGVAWASLALRRPGAGPAPLVAGLQEVLRRAGLSDLAGTLQSGDPEDAVRAFLDGLAADREGVLLVFDDLHNCEPGSAELLLELARGLPEPHRLLLLSRRLPAPLEPLRLDPRAVALTGADLAFTDDEVADLCSRGFGVELGGEEARRLRVATAGWAAPLVLAAPRIARAEEPAVEVQALAEQPSVLLHLVRLSLDQLPEVERRAVRALGHLPLLSPELVAETVRLPGLFDGLVDLGFPLGPLGDGWWELPGPVQEELAAGGELGRQEARRAAAVYARLGELRPALSLLLQAGEGVEAARLLAELAPFQLDALRPLELIAIVGSLAEEALRSHPRALLHLARACEASWHSSQRKAALDRGLAFAGDDAALRRELDAEVARDLARYPAHAAEAQALASRVLHEAGPEERAARCRALDVLGRCAAYWDATEEALARAEPLFEEAVQLARELRQATWLAQATMPLAYSVYFGRGQHARAFARFDEVLDQLSGRSLYRLTLLSWRADVLMDVGRYAEAESTLAEARELARLLRAPKQIADAVWGEARLAAQRGERERCVACVQAVEAERADWFDGLGGLEFLSESADYLTSVGEHELAAQYLERARSRMAESPKAFGLGAAAVLVHGADPRRGREAVDAVLRLAGNTPRERWRLTLLKAYAALRAGDEDAGRLAAEAFDAAGAHGAAPSLVFREPAIAERLLPLAAEAGSRAARTLLGEATPLVVSLLGGFEVLWRGRRLELPPGKPEEAVKAVAAAGGRLHSEELIEALWPGVEPASGRKRLRNALNRLRTGAGELLVREGELVRLPDGAQVDSVLFAAEARTALGIPAAAPDTGLARAALARYRGELLPEDPYAQWAAAARQRAHLLQLALLDLLAGAAEERGELDEAAHLLERTIDADRFDERRYLVLARIYGRQGRRGAALGVLRRSAAVLHELDLEPSDEHRALVRSLRS